MGRQPNSGRGVTPGSLVVPSYPYSTLFSATENPMYENGKWINGPPGASTVQTAGGQAFSNQLGGTGNSGDGIAFLAGSAPANQTVTAVVQRHAGLAPTNSLEIELLLRCTLVGFAGAPQWIECNFSSDGTYCQIILIQSGAGSGVGYAYLIAENGPSGGPQDGDVARASYIGTTITVQLARAASPTTFVTYATVTDSTLTTGTPGIGFFRTDPPGVNDPNDWFGFTSWSAT